LKPQKYRYEVAVPEAATLSNEADVRMAGVNVGKVKTKEFMPGVARTLVTVEIDPKYAPIPKDSHTMLRQKTLLGETYMEITPGSQIAGKLADGGRLPNGQVEPSVELDEVFQAFDPQTRQAFRDWVKESAKASAKRGGEDFNDALGNLGPFIDDASDVLTVLDDQQAKLKEVIKNTGVVFGALNERSGALRQLVINSDNVFATTAARDRELAETFRIFPTFLDESKATLARLQTFSTDTRPLVQDLKPVATDLGPTVRDLGNLAPDLKALFRDLDPLITVSEQNLPDAARFLRGAGPVLTAAHSWLQEFNPILAFLNYEQYKIAAFLSNGGAATAYHLEQTQGRPDIPKHLLAFLGVINGRSMGISKTRPAYDRGTSYPHPFNYVIGPQYGGIQNFSCTNNTATQGADKNTGEQVKPVEDFPPCKVQAPSEFDGGQYPFIDKGEAPFRLPAARANATAERNRR
jgi:virulence factor Mce-like protein